MFLILGVQIAFGRGADALHGLHDGSGRRIEAKNVLHKPFEKAAPTIPGEPGLPVILMSPRVAADVHPTLSTVLSMPGIDTAAPNPAETRHGRRGAANHPACRDFQ